MSSFIKQSLLVASVILAVGAAALPAEARSIPAYSGKPYNPADSECFTEWYGTAKNNCSGTRAYFIPLAVDPPTWGWTYAPVVTAYGATSANNVGCQAIGINKETTAYWGGMTYYLPTFGISADVGLGQAFVPYMGGLFAFCYVNQGGRVNVVHW